MSITALNGKPIEWNVGDLRKVAPHVAGALDYLCSTQGVSGAAELHLAPKCHAQGRIEMRYARNEQVLIVVCAECRSLVAKIKVAP